MDSVTPGTATRVPSASGTRTASACAPAVPRSGSFQKPPLTHEVCSPARQNSQTPQEIANGAITKSPGVTVVTSAPTSSTTPISSCPIELPSAEVGAEWYGCRSLPQTQARVTRTSASVGCWSFGSGAVITRTSPAPYR